MSDQAKSPAEQTPSGVVAISDEMVEAAAHAAWRGYHNYYAYNGDAFNGDGADCEDTWPETGLFPKAETFRSCARAALKAALSTPPQAVVSPDEGASRDPQNDQCGSRDEAALGATAALAPVAWRYEFSVSRIEDGYRDGSVVWHVGYSSNPPARGVRNLTPLYGSHEGSDALLAEAAALFRRYEREHNRKAEDAIEKGDVASAESSAGKATTNGVMAGRIELFRAAALRATASTTPESGTEKVAAQVEGENSDQGLGQHPVSALLGADCWRPIGTAPKDGTVIDVWRPEAGRDTVSWGYPHHECGEMGQYCDSDWHSIRAPGWVCNIFGELVGGKHAPFTHWMPVPDGPLEGQDGRSPEIRDEPKAELSGPLGAVEDLRAATIRTHLAGLIREYRASMPTEVMRAWAADLVAALKATQVGGE